MEIDEFPLGKFLVLRPVGRLDNSTSAEFQAKLLQAAEKADSIVDLAAVDYISSGGLRALMTAARNKPTNRRIAVAALHATVLEVFTIAHFEQVLPIFATIEEARRAWEPQRQGGRPA